MRFCFRLGIEGLHQRLWLRFAPSFVDLLDIHVANPFIWPELLFRGDIACFRGILEVFPFGILGLASTIASRLGLLLRLALGLRHLRADHILVVNCFDVAIDVARQETFDFTDLGLSLRQLLELSSVELEDVRALGDALDCCGVIASVVEYVFNSKEALLADDR